jgi:hypothetical protein
MSNVQCPSCQVVLPPQEVADGWCENCGKQIPPYVRSAATGKSESRQGRPETTPARTRVSIGGYFTVVAFIILGAVVTVVLENGKTQWTWLGCGIGAGLGVAVAQAAGLWPRKSR